MSQGYTPDQMQQILSSEDGRAAVKQEMLKQATLRHFHRMFAFRISMREFLMSTTILNWS